MLTRLQDLKQTTKPVGYLLLCGILLLLTTWFGFGENETTEKSA